jgi:hypothetical protein
MRNRILFAAPGALLVFAMSAPIAAQRPHANFRPASREASRPPIPREPAPRERGATPRVEPGRPQSAVPYVRDDQWYGHAAPNDPRLHIAHPFEFGRFSTVGRAHVYSVTRVDLGARRIWLPGGRFEIAAWDWPVTAPWCWTCDNYVVYLDPDHTGWYLLYDMRTGEYVHALFLGA